MTSAMFDPEAQPILLPGERIPANVGPAQYVNANVSAALRDVVPAERNRRLVFQSAREFAARTPSTPPWVLNGYVARGAITELVGKVKVAGKTTLALAMCRAIVRGEPFAGRPTERSGVLYLTEQADASFHEALARADLLDSDDFCVLSWHDAIGVPWPGPVFDAVVVAGFAVYLGYLVQWVVWRSMTAPKGEGWKYMGFGRWRRRRRPHSKFYPRR